MKQLVKILIKICIFIRPSVSAWIEKKARKKDEE